MNESKKKVRIIGINKYDSKFEERSASESAMEVEDAINALIEDGYSVDLRAHHKSEGYFVVGTLPDPHPLAAILGAAGARQQQHDDETPKSASSPNFIGNVITSLEGALKADRARIIEQHVERLDTVPLHERRLIVDDIETFQRRHSRECKEPKGQCPVDLDLAEARRVLAARLAIAVS